MFGTGTATEINQYTVPQTCHKRAIIAIAHKPLRTIFHMVQHRQPYRDTSVAYQALSVKRNAPRWIQALRKYGYIEAPA